MRTANPPMADKNAKACKRKVGVESQRLKVDSSPSGCADYRKGILHPWRPGYPALALGDHGGSFFPEKEVLLGAKIF